jgi:hypothetical protein
MDSSDIPPPKKKAKPNLFTFLAKRNRQIKRDEKKYNTIAKQEANKEAEDLGLRADRTADAKPIRINRYANETPEARAIRLADARQKRINRHANETPEARTERLKAMNQRQTDRHAKETPEARTERLTILSEGQIDRHEKETPKERADRLERCRTLMQHHRSVDANNADLDFIAPGSDQMPRELNTDFTTIDRSWDDISQIYDRATAVDISDLRTYRSDPLMAQHLFWETSGLWKFEFGNSEVEDATALKAEIEAHIVTADDVNRCVENFKYKMDNDKIKIRYCGACGGLIMMDMPCTDLPLSELDSLKLTEAQFYLWNSRRPFLKQLYSVFQEDGNDPTIAYHLIPDLVFRDSASNAWTIYACKQCAKAIADKSFAKYSVANGYDYGCLWRSTMPELSLVEKCLIAKVRIYADVVKLRAPEQLSNRTRSHALKGHVIAMKHTGAIQAASVLPRLTVNDFVHVVFIGDKDRWNNVKRNWREQGAILDRLQVRPDVVKMWLQVLKEVNVEYVDIDILPFTQEQIASLEAIPEEILTEAHVTDDEQTARLERYSTSSTAPSVADNNTAAVAEGADDAFTEGVDETDRIVDTVLLQDDNDIDDQRQFAPQRVLRALDKTLQDRPPPVIDDVSASSTTAPPTNPTRRVDIAVERGNQPLNEFTDNDRILYSAFPWLFLFRQGIPMSATMPSAFAKVILSHFNKAFGEEHKLIFTLYDQLRRHRAAQICSARVYSNNQSIKKFMRAINAPNFDAKLKEAMLNPDTREAKTFLKKILPNIKMAAGKIPFGDMERQESKYHLFGMAQRFGAPAFFLTMTPNEIHGPLCLRLCRRDNDKYVTLFEMTLLSAEDRAYLTSKNPVAAAIFFETIINHALRELLEIQIDFASKTTIPLCETKRGVLSKIIAYYGVIESQGRGTLHLHILLWGALPPFLLQKCAEFDDLVEVISRALDSMVSAEISKSGYDARKERSENRVEYYPSLEETPIPSADPAGYVARVERVGTAVQVHSHCFTCHKGKSGKFGCRSCYACTLRDQPTGPMQIVSQHTYNDDIEVVALPSINAMVVSDTTREHYPLYSPDSRIIVWELHRPRIGTDTAYIFHRKNRWVVPFTKALTACLGTNTANLMLGSSEQAKGSMFYMMDYMVKNATACANTLSLIYEARLTTQRYGSTADDAGTDERKTTHFLNRIVNQISAKSEISVMMASAALLGMPSSVSSHKFKYVYIQPAIAFVKTRSNVCP